MCNEYMYENRVYINDGYVTFNIIEIDRNAGKITVNICNQGHQTTLANELNLTLTGRDCGLNERVPMTGIPNHAIDNYVNKLIERGYKVILAENLDNVLEFKNLDEYEELSEEEMRKFDSYVDENLEELPTVSKIVGQIDDDDEGCTDLLNAESAKAFDKEATCIISDLFDGEITLA